MMLRFMFFSPFFFFDYLSADFADSAENPWAKYKD